jgi:Flp pilus assembly protein protease CpaA
MEIFILTIALLWLIIATISDIKTQEIPDWLNFSLITIALLSYSLISIKTNTIKPLLYSIAFLILFFFIGSLMYYTKQWGGGDAKLLAALGASFPFYPQILTKIFSPKLSPAIFPAILLLNIVIIGSIYGLIMLLIKILKNKKEFSKEFKLQITNFKKTRNILLMLSLPPLISSFLLKHPQLRASLFSLAFIIPIMLYLYVIIKSSEKVSMIKRIPTSQLREGDWVTHEIKINNKIIYKPCANGITKDQIQQIKKHLKEVEIKEGIIFVPTFLIATIISLILGNPILWLF